MTPEAWWQRRLEWAKSVMAECFANGFGSMAKIEPHLAQGLTHLLSRPGSLVRAVTAYLIGLEMGVVDEAAKAIGCGIEYLHTASLVFDDLPAMDDARMRRGAPCLHVVQGETVAILAALALVNRGYSMLWQGISQAQSGERMQEACDLVDACLGVHGVIGGQAMDLRGAGNASSVADVTEVAARKTGDLLRLTLVLPALVGNGTDREIQLLNRIGLMRGLAYQAADDLKDVLGAEEETGKTASRDQTLGRPNLIMAEGFQATLRRFSRLRRLGDRMQSALPGSRERWGMLAPLRVTLPVRTDLVGSLVIMNAV
jgi:geranylgeranyl pyrophosphate synthase